MTSTQRQRHEGNRPKKKMSKEQLQLALTKKKECDARALTIVERLIETEVDETWLLVNLERLNRCHMDDIVEERAILKRCGYPLCDNPLKANINQRYHISTRSNKVYDVSRRKNFCSNDCYGASNYILEQMFTSPLWLRDPKEKPRFHLLPVTGLSKKSTPGDEVDLGRENITVETSKTPEDNENISSDELPRAEDISSNKPDDNSNKAGGVNSEEKLTIERTDPRSCQPVFVCEKKRCETPVIERDVKSDRNNIPAVVPREKKNREKRRIGKNSEENKFDPNWLVRHIESYLREWLTLDSLALLLGDTALKRREIKEITKEMNDGKLRKKYVEFCQKVDSLQIDGESEDEESKADLRPLPNYGVLKEEGKKLEVKVRAFYHGQTVIETPIPSSDNPVGGEDGDSRTFMPLRGEHDPKMLRRRIVLEKLDKVLPEMLRTLAGCEFIVRGSIESNGCGESIRALVNTFSLSASNVIPKPAEWNLLGLVFVKLLSISEPRLRFLLKTERATKYVTMILMSYNLEPNYLDRLVATVTDIQSYRDRNSARDTTAPLIS